MPPEPVRTYRLSEEPYRAAMDRAYERREKDGLAGIAQLAVRAYAVDPEALVAACRRILGESS